MTDQEFLMAFNSGTIQPAEFTHSAHIRLAYLYLKQAPFLEACIAMRDGLKRFAASIGKATLYHETITVAFMSIIYDRICSNPEMNWEQLLVAFPDLIDKQLLHGYYPEELLMSASARERFILCRRTSSHPK